MSRRTLVPILIVLGLGGLGLAFLSTSGGSDQPGSVDPNASFLQGLRGRLTVNLPTSQLGLVSGDPNVCQPDPARLEVPVMGACVYTIEPGSGSTRRLSLTLAAGGRSVRLLLEQPEYLRVDKTLKAGEAADLDVFSSQQSARLIFQECVPVHPERIIGAGRLENCILEIKE